MTALVFNVAVLLYSDIITPTGSKVLFSLPAKAVLLYLSASIDIPFSQYVTFTLTCKFPDTTVLLTVPNTNVAGVADKEYDYNSMINSTTVAGNVTAAWSGVILDAWSMTADLLAQRAGHTGFGTQSAALVAGGWLLSPIKTTELFNGITWVASGDLTAARCWIAGAGTQGAGLAMGGSEAPLVTEKFNGVVWAASGNLNNGRYYHAAAGTSSAGLCFGGIVGVVQSDSTETFNGAIWANSGNLNTARAYLAGAGTQGAGLSMGGILSAVCEKFNGAVWVATASLNTWAQGNGGAGTQSAAMSIGGSSSNIITELFDGAVWKYGGQLNYPRNSLSGAGTQGAGLSMGGQDSNILKVCEMYAQNVVSGYQTAGKFTVRYAYMTQS